MGGGGQILLTTFYMGSYQIWLSHVTLGGNFIFRILLSIKLSRVAKFCSSAASLMEVMKKTI